MKTYTVEQQSYQNEVDADAFMVTENGDLLLLVNDGVVAAFSRGNWETCKSAVGE